MYIVNDPLDIFSFPLSYKMYTVCYYCVLYVIIVYVSVSGKMAH